MPQNKIHILCTRILEPMLVTKAAEKNILIDTIPFIKAAALQDDEVINLLKEFSQKNIYVVFTSAMAAEAVAQVAGKNAAWKIFCIGGSTKEAVIKNFLKSKIETSAKNASLLAEKIIAHKNIKEVIFFCGDQRMSDLPEKLSKAGIAVKETIVYKNIQLPKEVDENYHGILFFSPSAVHSFFSENTIAGDVILFAIGNTTASAIKTYCVNKILVSEWPGAESLINLMIENFEKNKITE